MERTPEKYAQTHFSDGKVYNLLKPGVFLNANLLSSMGDFEMEEPREISVSINERFFTIDLPIRDETLVASVLLGLGQYVKRGLPIRVKQSYITFSGSQEVSTIVISSTTQIAKWGREIRGLMSALLKR